MDAPLSETEVLFVDCQTTGATPDKGELLDLAWASCRTGGRPNVCGGLLQIDGDLPRRISRITGVTAEMLEGAAERDQLRLEFEAALESHDGLVIAHWARFERRFLDAFLAESPAWPRELICTHAIARRLLSELPRLGIRALSGYFGSSMDEDKRASGHVRATARIWSELVGLLLAEGVETVSELEQWLATTDKPKRSSGSRRFPLPKDVRLELPEEPGVYRMLGRDGVVLYVGKATSLKARVNSYYRGRKGEGERKLELVTQVWSLDVTKTQTPLHAAILENREIKAHEPAYNRQLRSRHRQIAFANPRDLTSIRPRPDSRHTLGPLPSPRAFESAVWLIDAMSGKVADLDFAEVTPEAVEEGLELFRALAVESGFGVPDVAAPTSLAELGAVFRRIDDELDDDDHADEELDDGDEGDDEGSEDGKDDGNNEAKNAGDSTGEVRIWTARDVCEFARWVARGMDRTLRRARSFQTFRDGDLRWVSPVSRTEHRLTWRNGRVAGPDAWEHEPATDFDLERYDETSVIIGELRRLIRYEVELELNASSQTWDREALAAFFRGET